MKVLLLRYIYIYKYISEYTKERVKIRTASIKNKGRRYFSKFVMKFKRTK